MSKFGPSEFSPEETKALADKLSDYDLLSRDSLAKLVKQGKFPPLAPLEDVPAHAFRVTPSVAPRVNPRQTLENAVKQAFFGKTDGIDDKSRADVRAKLSKMTWGEARGIWQTIANEMAVDCCDGDGNVDVERLRRWKEFLGNAENFRKGPFRFIPHTELMRSQMHRVCECLLDNQNGARDQLNAAKGITVGENGQDILKNISLGRQQSLCPGEAILASLLTPHRQLGLPTCTIHSLINAEIRNHPERLIKMYIQMLRDGQFTFPSGYAVQLQPMVGGSVTVDLRYGGAGRNRLFKDITDGDRAKIDQQIKDWKREGIEYVESTDETKKYKLKMPVYNMNDILFTHFCRASNFGNGKIDISEYGTMLVYAGNDEYSATTPVDGSKFLEGIAKLKTQAEDQKKLGHNYMRVVTQSSEGTHAENIDIDAILALDPNTMEPGKAYPIGDRNWYGDMSLDIPCLAVRKVDGTPPTYEFGTLCKESQFDNKNMTRIWVYGPDIEEHDAQYWARFKP
jgi:hypothetical protein